MINHAHPLFGFLKLIVIATAALASILAIGGVAHAAKPGSGGTPPSIQVDSINNQDPGSISCPDNALSGPVTIMGSGAGSAPPGKVEQYGVLINWGDGSPVEIASSTFTPPSGSQVDFTFVFQTAGHVYEDGAYTISISLFHSEPSGNDNQIDATVTLDVCTFTPVDPAIQIDLVNGIDPDALSCPDSPLENPIAISGSGEGSAPPAFVEDYRVTIDWGDGSAIENATAAFTPSTGSGVNFTLTFDSSSHVYTQGGSYMITASLLYPDPDGPGDLVAASAMIEVCIQLPRGTVTGEVFDAVSGNPIFGAVVEDITDQTPILGSFPGGSVYVVKPPEGLRTIRVSAPGWQDGVAQVSVIVDEVTTRDFILERELTALNVVQVTLPIGGNNTKVFLLPECVEAVVNDEVIATTCVHAGNIYYFVGLPDGPTTFRAANAFYSIDTATPKLDNDEKDNGDDAPNKNPDVKVRLNTKVPDVPTVARVPAITGGITGVTSNGTSPVATSVFATFDFEGVPVTVMTDSNVTNGAYALDLIPPGEAEVYAHSAANSTRSLDVTTTVIGGQFVTRNLTVFPIDAETENFVPVISSPTQIATEEDVNVTLNLDSFSVTDGNDPFSASHTLQVYPGFNYTVSNAQPKSAQVVLKPNYFGTATVPVTVNDGTTKSAPFNLKINVASVPDLTVFVDFEGGKTASDGGGGTDTNPLKTLADALTVVSPGGSLLLSGTISTEPLFTINQFVILRNNNPDGAPVRIVPGTSGRAETTDSSKTGFVSRSEE